MELKTPTKKGIKTPRYRPPLPMLNDSCSGYCVEEYDWPLFSGYYNGTSIIVDDSQAMTLLTNKVKFLLFFFLFVCCKMFHDNL